MRGGHLYGSLIDILSFGAPLMLVALGMTLVIATGGIDLSVGAVAAISGACACLLISRADDQNSVTTVLVAVAAALALSMLLGLWNGVLVAVIGIQPIIATLILMVAGRGIAQLITTGQIITITSSPYKVIGGGYLLTLPFAIFVVAGVFTVTALVCRRTALGMLIEAVGGNKEASRLAGVRSRGLIILAYVFSALCAGIAGLMISSIVSSADGNNAGLWIELDAILAVVIGGTALAGGRFFLAGTIVGAILIQTLVTTIYSIGIPPETNLLFKALVVTLVCLIQSPAFRAKVFHRRSRPPTRRKAPRPDRRQPARGDGMSTAVADGERNRFPLRIPLEVRADPDHARAARGDVHARRRALSRLRHRSGDPQRLHRQLVPARGRVGMTFVILTGGIDLSVGAVVALSTLTLALLVKHGWPTIAAILVVLVIGSALGWAMGCVIHYFEIQPFIVTLAGMFLARGLCYAITVDAVSITKPDYVAIAEHTFELPGDMYVTTAVLVAFVAVLVGMYVLHYTRLGRNVYAVGGNEQSALLMGLPVARTKILVYTFSGFCSALGGVLLSFYMLSGSGSLAVGMELDAIAAVVIGGTLLTGGTGYLAGSVLGVLVLGLIQTLINFQGTLSSWWTRIVIGLLLFAFILLQRVVFLRRKS